MQAEQKIHGEEEHSVCAVREDTVIPSFPWWRSTRQGSMGKHVTLTKGDHRQAAAFFHGCCPWNWHSQAKTLRRLKTRFWEWPNRKMGRLEPLTGHWSEQAWSFLSSMPLLMCGEVWRGPFPYLQTSTTTNVNKWNKFNLEEEKMTKKIKLSTIEEIQT